MNRGKKVISTLILMLTCLLQVSWGVEDWKGFASFVSVEAHDIDLSKPKLSNEEKITIKEDWEIWKNEGETKKEAIRRQTLERYLWNLYANKGYLKFAEKITTEDESEKFAYFGRKIIQIAKEKGYNANALTYILAKVRAHKPEGLVYLPCHAFKLKYGNQDAWLILAAWEIETIGKDEYGIPNYPTMIHIRGWVFAEETYEQIVYFTCD